MRLHHVQVCCPRGGAAEARRWDTFPGHRRVHVADGHGNRGELLA